MSGLAAVILVAIALFGSAAASEAQQPPKPVRIGMALGGTPEGMKYRVEGFLQGMRALGYVEGRNLQIEYRYTGDDPRRRREVAADVVRLKPDIIVVSSTGLTDAVRKATATIPIVVGNAGDLVGTGVVASLARPGGNVTGSTDMAADLAAKRLELLKEFAPKIERIGVVWYGLRGYSDEEELNEIEAVGKRQGIAVLPVQVKDPRELQAAYASLRAQKADAVIIIQNTFTFQHRRRLSELAIAHRLPAVCEESAWVEDGCLISYGPDKVHSFRLAATFVDKIVKGAKPAELPVEQPTRFEMVVNGRTAKTMGLSVPAEIRVRADRVIE